MDVTAAESQAIMTQLSWPTFHQLDDIRQKLDDDQKQILLKTAIAELPGAKEKIANRDTFAVRRMMVQSDDREATKDLNEEQLKRVNRYQKKSYKNLEKTDRAVVIVLSQLVNDQLVYDQLKDLKGNELLNKLTDRIKELGPDSLSPSMFIEAENNDRASPVADIVKNGPKRRGRSRFDE